MLRLKQLAFDRMNHQSQASEMIFNGESSIREEVGVVAEQGEVVHVAEVLGSFQFLFDEVVETIEIQVSEELAGQITDWQSAPPLRGRKEMVTGKATAGSCSLQASMMVSTSQSVSGHLSLWRSNCLRIS